MVRRRQCGSDEVELLVLDATGGDLAGMEEDTVDPMYLIARDDQHHDGRLGREELVEVNPPPPLVVSSDQR